MDNNLIGYTPLTIDRTIPEVNENEESPKFKATVDSPTTSKLYATNDELNNAEGDSKNKVEETKHEEDYKSQSSQSIDEDEERSPDQKPKLSNSIIAIEEALYKNSRVGIAVQRANKMLSAYQQK
jgi:hypothetical protein